MFFKYFQPILTIFSIYTEALYKICTHLYAFVYYSGVFDCISIEFCRKTQLDVAIKVILSIYNINY